MITDFPYAMLAGTKFIWYERPYIELNFAHARQAIVALARLRALRALGLPISNCKLTENQT